MKNLLKFGLMAFVLFISTNMVAQGPPPGPPPAPGGANIEMTCFENVSNTDQVYSYVIRSDYTRVENYWDGYSWSDGTPMAVFLWNILKDEKANSSSFDEVDCQ